MANITLKEWRKYKEIMRMLCDKAEDEFIDLVRENGGYGTISDQALVTLAYEMVTKYGEGSAAITASLYDTLAILEGANVPPAELMQLAYDEVAKTVYAVRRDYTDMNYLKAVVGKMVKQTGADTMMRNAVRDGAEFAWIPSGATCAFCLTLASNGWQKASKKAIKNGHAEHIHPNCDCQYCVRFDSTTSVEGYHPEEYRKMYYSAEGRTPRDKINSMRRNSADDDNDSGLIMV